MAGTGSETPRGGYQASRVRATLNGEFIAGLLRDFRQHGQNAIMRARRDQPANYLKIIALLVPKEHKVEHTNVVGQLSDDQLATMIYELEDRLEARAKGIIDVTPTSETPALPKLSRQRPNAMLAHADSPIAPKTARYRKAKPRAQARGQSDSTPD